MALTPEEAAAVWRRAAALDARDGREDGMTEAVVREAAREVGLSASAVEQAVSEWRSGQLDALPALAPVRRLGLVGRLVVERAVPLTPADASAAVEAWLRAQWFEPRRAHGDTRDWVARSGALARARRAADVRKQLRLSDASRLRVTVHPVGDTARVEVVAELDDLRRGLLAGGVGGSAVLGVAAGVAVALAVDLPTAVESAGVAGAGVGTAGAGWVGSRRTLDRRRTALAEELELALAGLAPPTPSPALPAWVPPAVGKWAKRLRG